jgi:hypothetical protein
MHGVRAVDSGRKYEENMREGKSEVKEWETDSNSGVEGIEVVGIRKPPRKESSECAS